MAKSKPKPAPALFAIAPSRNRRVLILPRFLAEEADKQAHRDAGLDLENARAILEKWADKESAGHLVKKETAVDASFLADVFGNALHYNTFENAAPDGAFFLDRQFTVPGIGPADAALGHFGNAGILPASASAPAPVAVIELKGSATDLDTDRSNGRTAVQQLFDYLNGLPDTHWGIVSNFSTIRLYHKRDSRAFEEFSLQRLKIDQQHFEAFWCLLERNGLIATPSRPARADQLLIQTGERKKEVGDELYAHYSQYRNFLIATLQDDFAKPQNDAIRIAQRIFDRIIFIAFCQDNGLIRSKAIELAIKQVRAFEMVKNPRWQNFKSLFHFIDKGHPSIGVEHGYNGGLFNDEDDQSIAQLELPDEPWTTAFARFGTYDFKHEVSVDVLGHIFERSITELEKRRAVGLFEKTDPSAPQPPQPKMQKSAERKRFGIYYTPPEFTKFIVKHTVEELLLERFKNLEQAHGVTPDELAADFDTRSPRLQAYYRHCLQTLRNFKIVDPACGSGAFLIAAYELLEDLYADIVRHLIAQGVPDAPALREQIPDFILKDNLYGIDLSEEAVEITRLALWIRSAHPGKTLADLSRNVLCGNSLVDDINVHPRAMNWQTTFPDIFQIKLAPDPASIAPRGNARQNAPTDDKPPARKPGFDAVIGNPPWERIKLQEREFFAFAAPEIASAVSAATRRKLIEALQKKDPELHARYLAKQSEAEKTSEYVRASNRFPLTAQGDLNTYMLFAELARALVAPIGRVGILVPSGIATDYTTKDFFADLIDSESLIKLYDFENKLGIFEDVHRSFRFCTLILSGPESKSKQFDFLFFAHSMEELEIKARHIPLTKKDIALINPNSKTCPILETRRDAKLAREIYGHIPVLIDKNRKSGGNPWSVTYHTMFHQTNDAESFIEPADLRKKGLDLAGARFIKGKIVYFPLYEAKMFREFDHRFGTVFIKEENWVNQGQTYEATLIDHQNPEFVALPRWWAESKPILNALGERKISTLLAFRDIARATDTRTMIASFLPLAGTINTAPVLLFDDNIKPPQQCCLLANLNSFIYDYVARQKTGGTHLNFFIVEQLPTVAPDAYADKTPWTKKQTLEQWISERVLKLSCTANDMIPLAQACNFNPHGDKAGGGIPFVWKWKEQERAELRAQLDAAYFHLYGISRDDAAYILSTFQTSGSSDEGKTIAPQSTAELILTYYDQFAP